MAAQMVLNDELFVMKQQLQNIENLLVENNKYGLSVKEAARYSGIGRSSYIASWKAENLIISK